jgi:hypothetical protein
MKTVLSGDARIASLVGPIPHTESQGIKAGGVNIGVGTSLNARVANHHLTRNLHGRIHALFAGAFASVAVTMQSVSLTI